MANGTTALRLFSEPEIPDAPGLLEPTEIGIRIGAAVASAATGLCYGLAEYKNGWLTDKTRTENGKRIAALAMLRLDTVGDPGLDFFGVARVEGARILRTYFDTDFYRAHGPGAGEATIDGIISSVFEIVERVVASEMAFLAN